MKRSDLERLAINIRRESGDALEGERIIAQARKIDNKGVVPGTATHRIQEVVLRSNVLCVLDRSFRTREVGPEEPFRLQ
jgi:hypothetical protein